MRMIQQGNAFGSFPTVDEFIAQVKAAGFEVEEHFDLMDRGEDVYGSENHWPWW